MMQSGELFITTMSRRKPTKTSAERLTISLGAGQRSELETIAKANHTSLAFVIRHALNYFVARHRDKQLRLDLPL
jgi:hypothetical protein